MLKSTLVVDNDTTVHDAHTYTVVFSPSVLILEFFDEWNEDWSSVGWHEGWEQTYDTSASSFSLGHLDIGDTSSPKRFEWVKMNVDTGAAVNTLT